MRDINLIFDFDGTLIDSFEAAMSAFNLLAKECNFKSIRDHEIHQLKHLSSKELIQYLEVPLYKVPSVLLKARALMRADIKALPVFANLYPVMEQMRGMNVNLGILTSNSLENVIAWLQANNMDDLFNFIHVESSYFGKKHILKKIIKNYKLNKASTFYIGDETRDIEAAKACGIHSVAVTWGFNSEKILLQHQPHFLVRKPEELLTHLMGSVG